MIKNLFSQLFGNFSWTCPPWLTLLQQKTSKLFWLLTLVITILIIISIYGYTWYQKRPHPELIIAHVNTPKITPLSEDTLTPDNLSIDFGTDNSGFTSQSVAPIQFINKEVSSGITIYPAIPGKWFWESDSQLRFHPAEEWPAEQTYHIHFDKHFFSSHTKMARYDYSFTTLPFQLSINKLEFYQNPMNPQIREIVATLSFNYPVDSTSLEQHTHLILQALNNNQYHFKANEFKYTITYDKFKRTAYLHSEPLPLPETERYLELSITQGVKSLTGPGVLNEGVTQQVLVPDAGSFFKLNNISASIVRNERDQPEQVLTIESSLGVTSAELNKNMHIYLLPRDYPATSIETAKENYHWQNPGEITPTILALATPLNTQPIPADRDYSTLHSYKFNVESPQFIYIKIDKGTRSFGDYILANDYLAIVQVPEYPKEIGFLHKGALLSLNGEKKLSVTARGIPAAKFVVARVLPDDVNQLITQTNGTFSDPNFLNDSFNENNISEIFSEIKSFDASHPEKQQYAILDLGHYLSNNTNSGGPLGLFLLKAQAWDNNKKIPLNIETSRLILITDLGLIVKDNKDGSHDVFVQSISSGKPSENVNVSVLGKNGLPIVNHITNNQGYVHFSSLSDFIDEHAPTVYLARLGNDVSFMPFNNEDRQLNYSRFDVGGISNIQDQNLTAFIFTDRGIYRPGDTAHIGMIVKQAYVNPQPAGLPLQMTITDPRGIRVQDKKFTLDNTGYLTFDFPTQLSSPTGEYNISLFIVKDNHSSSLLGSTTLNVAEFLPDRMHISTHLSTENRHGWISPSDLTAKVILTNLYGFPAANRKISARLLLTPQTVKFSEFPQYTFVDPLLDPKKPPKVFTDTLPDVQTDANGQATVNLKLERFDKTTYQLTFFVEGFESEGGRSVSAQTTALVSPLHYLVGYKPDGDLHFIKQDTLRQVHFIAINPELKLNQLTPLKMEVYEEHPISTLIKKPDGTYQYQSVIQTNLIKSADFTIDIKGTDYILATDQIGDFSILLKDQNGNELSHFNYTVVGASQQPIPKNAELNVKLNRSEFPVDTDIQMEITSPYTGTGLITIERDKVYAYKWFKTDTTSSVQTIHIPKDFQGNGYINVDFVRDWNSPEIFMTPLSYSIVPFSVTHENHDIHVTLSTPDMARPGEPFIISYKSDKPGKIIVFAVDEGILQVTHYTTPSPSEYFFQKQALQVSTQQIVDQIIPKFLADRELSAVGGDEGKPDLNKLLNPFKRKTDLPVVYWSGLIDTTTTPQQLTYNVPDYFNGSLRVMAVAASTDAVGDSEKSSLIRGDFIINPNAPTFVAPHDEFEVTASIANNVKNSGKNALVNIKILTTPNLEMVDAGESSLKINEGEEKTIHVKLRARPEPGTAEITFIANIGDKSSKMHASFSIRPPRSLLTTINNGYSSDTNKSFTLNRELYSENRSLTISASVSPLILVAGLERYLNNFPFGCTEQLVSKAFPLLAMTDQPWYAQDTKIVNEKVDATITMLSQRQLSSGGFSYWPDAGNNENNSFASVYAMHFLTEARSHGYVIPNEIYSSGIAYLKDFARQTPENFNQARIQAYAIYILTRNEIVTTNYLTNLQIYLEKSAPNQWHQDITAVYIASIYQLLKDYSQAEKLVRTYKPSTSSVDSSNDFYTKNIENAQYLYLLARHFPDLLAKEGNKQIDSLVSELNNDEINTVLSSYASLALSSYAHVYQTASNQTLGIEETLQDGKQKTLAAADSMYQNIETGDNAKTITINNPTKQHYFYQLTQSGFDKNPSNHIIKDHLEVYREFRDDAGKVINSVELGKELEVHIIVRTLDNQYHSNIAIIDLLPGGFEVVSDSLAARTMDYSDVREDRVIFFGTVGPNATEIVYRIKATNTGKYIVPSISAVSMYNPFIQARSEAGSMTVS